MQQVAVSPHGSCYNTEQLDSCDSRIQRVSAQQGRNGRVRRMCPVLRPCCAETHWTRKNYASHAVYNTAVCQGGNPSVLHTYIDLSNFCHFFLNKDSKYCFFSCKRCSWRFNNGHLLSFRAYLIFLHRASKALSRAANSFIVISWSRLLRNIHS